MMDKLKSKSNIQQAIPFFWVKDITISLRFYVEGLGFEIKNKWIDNNKIRWCRLENGGATIMLQEFWKEGHHANLPKGEQGEGVSIYFFCEDTLKLYREITSSGITVSEPVVGNGIWVIQLSDPDGYDIYFQSPTDASQETKYSDLTI